ncbi:MAG: helix-turn-helix transcriptional regulator [Actinomycetota bacterium]|nr:helix-turn-helix transcriptional regulator [Actinomycetota bacterium]
MDSQGPLNTTAAAMLGLLSQIGPINGNGLSSSADVLIGDYWTLTRSQVYRELQNLERRGFVHAGPLGPRSSREFSLTESGRAAFHEWLDAGPAGEVIRFPMLLTIRFASGLPPERLRDLLDDFESRHRAKREFYEQLEADLVDAQSDPFEIATVRFGRLFEAAVATWLDELANIVP